MDPLYHQTTAQFDEGGAKGLLLNNLGIYGGCRVLFDSQEVPAKCISSINDTTSSNHIDISFAGGNLGNITMFEFFYRQSVITSFLLQNALSRWLRM